MDELWSELAESAPAVGAVVGILTLYKWLIPAVASGTEVYARDLRLLAAFDTPRCLVQLLLAPVLLPCEILTAFIAPEKYERYHWPDRHNKKQQ